MLRSIKIENFAIIDNTEISFRNGLTVLTGETGAGKTIIIDAINLLLGERASLDMIRHGSSKAVIEGNFSVNPFQSKRISASLDIDIEGEVKIVRQLLASGSSNLRLNGKSINLNSLKSITKYLIDIHQQHDTHRLFEPANYLDYIDNLGEIELSHYKEYLSDYKKLIRKYNNLLNINENMQEQLDYFEFQLEELRNADLDVNEEVLLIEEENKIKNYDKIYKSLNDAYIYLSESNVLENIYSARDKLESISSIEEYTDLSEGIGSIYYEVEELSQSLKDKVGELDFDPARQEYVMSRLSEITKLKRKYKKDVPDLIQLKEDLEERIEAFSNKDAELEKLETKIQTAHSKLVEESVKVSKLRRSVAIKLEEDLQSQMSDLYLPKASFKVQFNLYDLEDIFDTTNFYDNGVDEIDFLITTNIGEPLKPLNKTASGGEISRIMLGLKTIILKSQGLSTVIFDEIDSGISGQVAHSIAKKVKLISENTQVLLITHLPQVAAIADHHIFVSKSESAGRTISKSKYLNKSGRIKEIAKMLSSKDITEIALANAENLINEYTIG